MRPNFVLVCLTLLLALSHTTPTRARWVQAFRSGSLATYQVFTGATSRTVVAGAGWANGDVLVGVFSGYDGSGITLTAPTGWTTLNTCSQNNARFLVAWVAHGGSAPSLAFGMGTASNRTGEALIAAFTGVDTTTPIAGTPAYGAGFTASVGTLPNPPSADVGTDSLVVIGGFKVTLATTDWTHPGAYTMLQNGAVQDSLAFAYGTANDTGTEDPAAFTGGASGTDDGCHGFTLGLSAGGAPPAASPSGLLLLDCCEAHR